MDNLLEGIAWLAEGGRNAAKELWANKAEIDMGQLDEALAWLNDLLEGKEP